MRKPHHYQYPERKWLIPLITSSVLSLLLLLAATVRYGRSSSPSVSSRSENIVSGAGSGPPRQPRLAYLISGTKGDALRLRRVLQAVYHPWNYYLLHLDFEGPAAERIELAKYVRSEPVLVGYDNVRVVGNANMVTYKGPTMIAVTLHAVAILLRQGKEWDWFINLSASDYPLMSQDGELFYC